MKSEQVIIEEPFNNPESECGISSVRGAAQACLKSIGIQASSIRHRNPREMRHDFIEFLTTTSEIDSSSQSDHGVPDFGHEAGTTLPGKFSESKSVTVTVTENK